LRHAVVELYRAKDISNTISIMEMVFFVCNAFADDFIIIELKNRPPTVFN